ncbi:MAG TPA: hypothetical protein VFB60_05760 [Ktedonobacteraceae bacterium]|nr:hypothetical protein [Ktedonobacteraceae bacterium]
MSGRLKINALFTLVLAVLFYAFFQISKHNTALSQVNPFADDPYDAVGSFGVQFALFAGLLSLVRAFRPYQSIDALKNQELLLLRGEYLLCLSVMITLAADIVALVRHPSSWIGSPAGYLLAALTGGLMFLAALGIWLIHYSAPNTGSATARNAWLRAAGVIIVSILILALYPESWRQSTHGELFTVLVGIAFLFVPLWAVGIAISPSPGTFFEDCIDDFAAMHRWLKAHAGPFVVFCNVFETIAVWSFVRPILNWINPHKHTWNFAILLGIAMGIVLVLGETLGEGGGPPQVGRLVLVTAIFISLECAGVLLGYALLAKPMGLFRETSIAQAF